MLRADNAADLESISAYLGGEDGRVRALERDELPTCNRTPAPQVEFEVRHTREHLEKLKFNWLELHTKRDFLRRLGDSEQWQACLTSCWTPGDLKQLEREIEPSKGALKQQKAQTAELLAALSSGCERLVALQEGAGDKHGRARDLLRQYGEEAAELAALCAAMPAAPKRTAEQTQAVLDEQSIAIEKRLSALDRQRGAVADLERLLALHEGESARLADSLRELEERRAALARRDAPEDVALSHLCRWHAAMSETVARISACRVEMVRPDYLLVAVGTPPGPTVPVHITVNPLTAKLEHVRIGATSSTPKRQWKELLDAAIDFNDISFLLRAILAAIPTSTATATATATATSTSTSL